MMLLRRNHNHHCSLLSVTFRSFVLLSWWSTSSIPSGSNVLVVDARSSSQIPLAFSLSSSHGANRLLSSKFTPRHFCQLPSSSSALSRMKPRSTSASTGLNMFMGSDGGILGIGTPEVVRLKQDIAFVLFSTPLFEMLALTCFSPFVLCV